MRTKEEITNKIELLEFTLNILRKKPKRILNASLLIESEIKILKWVLGDDK